MSQTRAAFEDWYKAINGLADIQQGSNGYKSATTRMAWRAYQAAAEPERETCAKMAEALGSQAGNELAWAIRARCGTDTQAVSK